MLKERGGATSAIVTVVALFIVAVAVAVGFYFFLMEPEEGGPIPSEAPSPSTDAIPPNITNVITSALTPTAFTISWITDEPATTQIQCKSWDAAAYNYSQENRTLTLQHAYMLTNLTPHTEYAVIPMSSDEKGNNAVGNGVYVTTPGEPLPFKIIEPEPESINLGPTPYFYWEGSRYADKYVLEITTTPNFGNTVVCRKEVDAGITEHKVNTALRNLTKYYYRITAVNKWGDVAASNTPNWFTTSITLGKQTRSLAVAPDNTKAVVTYNFGKNVTVISLADPPHIVADFALPDYTGHVAITYDSRYAVITMSSGAGYTLDLNTLTISKIVYDNPDIAPLSSGLIIMAPNSDIAYLCVDMLNPSTGSEYTDYVVSVLDVPSAHVVDYIHVYERSSLWAEPVFPYAISRNGTHLYVGFYTGMSWNGSFRGFIETVDLPAKTIVSRTAFIGCDSGPWDMELTPDNKYGLVTVFRNASHYIWWWNMNTNKIEAELEYVGAAEYKAIAITPDGYNLVVRGMDKVGIISVSSHKVVEEHYCYRSAGSGVVVSSDGKFALVGGDGRLGILFLDREAPSS